MSNSSIYNPVQVPWRLMPPVGVLGRRGARRPDGTFAEALLAVPPFWAGPPAAAPSRREEVVRGSPLVEDDLDLRPGRACLCMPERRKSDAVFEALVRPVKFTSARSLGTSANFSLVIPNTDL
jgi:hypothetical protein